VASDREDRWGGNNDRRDRWDDDRDRRDDSPEGVIRRAQAKVAGPAIGLIITGILSLLSVVIGLVQVFAVGLGAQFDEQRKKIDQDPNMPAQQKAQMKDFMNTYERVLTVALPPVYLVASVVGVVTIIGGIKMRNLRGRGLAMTGSILSMIPCTSGCCIVGLPVGIWALVALSNPDVKAAFAANAAGGPMRDRYDDERDRGFER
jgi:predicted PurR-regulated permease PerM